MKYIILIGILVLLVGCEWDGDVNTNEASFRNQSDIAIDKECDNTKVILHYDGYEIVTTRKDICDSYIQDKGE